MFTSTASQHGGQETTITSFHSTLLHQGMIIVGVPYSEPRLVAMTEITGGTPYGASTITAADGSRLPTENELACVENARGTAGRAGQARTLRSSPLHGDGVVDALARPSAGDVPSRLRRSG